MSETSPHFIENKLLEMKKGAGTHSPSIASIRSKIPELEISVDACFLSNPYATDLFMQSMQEDLIDTGKLRDVLEFYPTHNSGLAEVIGPQLGVDSKNIFVANGAIEIIQAVLHRFVRGSVVLSIPTFSSYYEFAPEGVKPVFYELSKENDFALDVSDYVKFVRENGAGAAILINPNNPTGTYLTQVQVGELLEELQDLSVVIIDESFIHFASEGDDTIPSVGKLISKYPNLVVIKSMSKDFGIAGVRAGYGILSSDRVAELLENGYLWNSSGLAEYFFRLYAQEDFQNKYGQVRQRYINEMKKFGEELGAINGIRVYPSQANFYLCEIENGMSADDFFIAMLSRFGVYVRTCTDKIGLEKGAFVRIACRTEVENAKIIEAVKAVVGSSN
ncbi:MAG: aminotransferase [Candidatus Kerfeldbacteria bacterium CG15_BIG_FIL_POST_REV_8_21_14_020_45_12]|uniref:Aminotransferase n=1 Tax=Candidatus Kerfeldbacteria bacterium CG15_BIG_FIL_POST_REV_8_21_14_020_45_12 TaxID=2014247 RepID=A0A2M7H3E2_9BACT|nr:MAG: aminotransferase [Candidatus Kerfeldbacteria bacterium CG15_BIG_FIL_POST_REV_8_21_14_020_45_12]PJA93758.1 MAG: aminotransferase [Candidatus Kerfeldbacteria bacterium CG_4_9_14_3_um_filter_45_8]